MIMCKVLVDAAERRVMQDLLQGHGRNELYQPICAGCCQYPVHKPHSLDMIVGTSLTFSKELLVIHIYLL